MKSDADYVCMLLAWQTACQCITDESNRSLVTELGQDFNKFLIECFCMAHTYSGSNRTVADACYQVMLSLDCFDEAFPGLKDAVKRTLTQPKD